MKASELRIGNLLLFEGQAQYVSSIHSDDTIRFTYKIGQECHGCYKVSSKKIDPIPLTEEWLQKFGFEKSNEGYTIEGYTVSFDADYPLWFGQQGCCQYDTIKEGIKYVHQLQNLYFALTSKELKIIE